METRTNTSLAGLTDAGLFERIATAVLRLQPEYEGLAHPGINADGKTRKSPVDGLVYLGDDGSRIVIVHHTITAADSLENKWLLNPTTVKPRRGSKSASPSPGDVTKSFDIIREERRSNPGLAATLVLATNQEPDEALLRRVAAAGRHENVKMDLWTRSRIASRLDTDPRGQLIRRKLLGIGEELVSRELVVMLSRRSVQGFDAGDDVNLRVPRTIDTEFCLRLGPVTFVIGASGAGKTVACHKALLAHVSAGGGAIVLSDTVVEAAASIEQAVMSTLQRLHPELTPGQNPCGLFHETDPLLILVEDVSRSMQPARLVEKIASWSPPDDSKGRPAWKLLCPVWPQVLDGVRSQLRDKVNAMSIRPALMSHDEAVAAVVAHSTSVGVVLPAGRADAIATELGDDPLLIALNKDWSTPRGDKVIDRFVELTLTHAAQNSDHVAAELRAAMMELGEALLRHRRTEPAWSEVLEWRLVSVDKVRVIAKAGEVCAIEGSSTAARLRFRHDRVRDRILAETAYALDREGRLDDGLLSEPALAEVLGALLVRSRAPSPLVERILCNGPLALFHALRLGSRDESATTPLAEAAARWLRADANRGRATFTVRWLAMAALEGVEGEHVGKLISMFPEKWPSGMIAMIRNGDVRGGIALSSRFDIHTVVAWVWRAIQTMESSRLSCMAEDLGVLIDADDGSVAGQRQACIDFAGLLGEHELAPALQRCWARDEDRDEHLASYLWAMARCATPETASRLLDPVCALWAALPSEGEGGLPSPRDLAALLVRSAFERAVPTGALDYFVDRAKQPDLSWQIEYMLHGVDHPAAVLLQVERGAERLRANGERYFFESSARDHWRRANEGHGSPMSASTRNVLLAIWQDTAADTERRKAAFDLWAEGHDGRDVAILRDAAGDSLLSDRVLRAQLKRGDEGAIPALIGKLDTATGRSWWFYARHVWSAAMYDALDRALQRESAKLPLDDGALYEIGAVYTSAILRLPVPDAEQLLLRHWGALGRSLHFVQAALYVATPELVRRAAAVVHGRKDPEKLFRHLGLIFGLNTIGEVGITREVQVRVLEPYLGHLQPHEIGLLVSACNEKGWHALRRQVLDPYLDAADVKTAEWFGRRLDAVLSQGHPGFLDLDIDRLLRAGLSWGDLAKTLEGWLAGQPSREALEVAEYAIRHAGQRGDTEILTKWAGSDAQLLQDTVRDLDFALRRRDIR